MYLFRIFFVFLFLNLVEGGSSHRKKFKFHIWNNAIKSKWLRESAEVGRVSKLRIRAAGPHGIFVSWLAPYLTTNRPDIIVAYRIGWGKRYIDEYNTEVEGWRHGCRVLGLEADSKYVVSIRALVLLGYGPALYQTITTEKSPHVCIIDNHVIR